MPPHRRQPTRLPHPWDCPGKNTGVGCHFLLQCMKVNSEREVQSGLTLCDPMDCSLPGSSVHGIFQAKILEWATALLLQVIFWTQGLSLHLLRLLHWQMDSLPLHFLTFLVLQGASGSYCVFPATVFKSAIYLTSTGFIWRTRVFETKIWLLGVNSLFWGLFKMGFIPEMQWFLNFRRSIKIIIAID